MLRAAMTKRIRGHIRGAATILTLWPRPCELEFLSLPARVRVAKAPLTDEEALRYDWSKVGTDLQAALQRVLPEPCENVETERA